MPDSNDVTPQVRQFVVFSRRLLADGWHPLVIVVALWASSRIDALGGIDPVDTGNSQLAVALWVVGMLLALHGEWLLRMMKITRQASVGRWSSLLLEAFGAALATIGAVWWGLIFMQSAQSSAAVTAWIVLSGGFAAFAGAVVAQASDAHEAHGEDGRRSAPEKGDDDPNRLLPREKVETVRWECLSYDEKREFYEGFRQLRPRHHKPRAVVAPLEFQQALQTANPIDLDKIGHLLTSFGLYADNIRIPLTEAEYDSIHDLDIKYAERICDQIEKGPSEEQSAALLACYDYLSARDIALDKTRGFDCDVVVVPGARRGIVYRVDEAYRIVQQSQATLVLSGHHPEYESKQVLHIGEAEAMDFYLKYEKGLADTDLDVVLESRARNTRETVAHVMPHLQALYASKGAPLDVVLVTSPYHMRRFYLLMLRALEERPYLVSTLLGSPSAASFDRRTLLDNTPGARDRRRYGTAVYIQELFKLIGGRVTGEF